MYCNMLAVGWILQKNNYCIQSMKRSRESYRRKIPIYELDPVSWMDQLVNLSAPLQSAATFFCCVKPETCSSQLFRDPV